MKKKNGFTLVELLAVIVILAVILVIAVPKITDTIKNSKIASFESSAKTIAAQAEKKKMEKEILEDTGSINCSDVVKLNDSDYSSCSITFDGNTAKVNLVGSGKFEGLQIINGTKDSAKAEEIKAPVYGNAVNYVNGLYAYDASSNGLKKDNTVDANIRYYGENPNNYVSFNNELWRIIGVFGNNVKLVRKDTLGNLSWDSSDSSVNSGMGVNEWSQADLKNYLNTMYYGGTSVTCYNDANNTTTTCPTGSLNENAKSMIDNHTWATGAVTDSTFTVDVYNSERGSSIGKICTTNISCNDTVIRTTTWTGHVALPYITDWVYASGEADCDDNFNITDSSNNYICKNSNWMHYGDTEEDFFQFLSPGTFSADATRAWGVSGAGKVGNWCIFKVESIFPSIYLKSNVKIVSGSGTNSDPYTLSI